MNRLQLKSICAISAAILEAVPEQGIPSGTLYAALLGYMTINQYTGMITNLVAVDALSESGHYLTRGKYYALLLDRMTTAAKENV